MLGQIPHKYGALYPDDALRPFAVHVVGDIGSGKSSLLGRVIAFIDFLRGIPIVILDNGDAIDHFLHKFLKLPKVLQDAWWHRIRYVPLSGLNGYVVPFPLYYHLGEEDPLTVAQRFVETIIRMTPALQTAQIMGEGPIRDIAETMGVELVNRGWQLSELDKLTKKIPASLRVKMIPFMYSDTQRAIYCASLPGIDWSEVIAKQQIVLLDYRGVENPQFALSWALDYFLNFIKHRGTYAGPISVIIDELFALKRAQRTANAEFFGYWQDILKDIARHHNLWFFLAHQYMGQFDDEMQDLLLSIKTQIIGATLSMRTARALSQQLAEVDPYKIKRPREQLRPDAIQIREGMEAVGITPTYQSVPGYYKMHEEP